VAKRGEKTSKGSFDKTEKVKAGELLGADCPVKALGHTKGTYYFSDPVGQVRDMRAGEMTPNGLISLFGGQVGWLEQNCPVESKRSKGQDRTSWHNPTAVQRLVSACRRAGFFNPATQTRGPGIWPFNADLMVGEEFAGADQLVIHTGDRVGWVMYSQGRPEIEWLPAGAKIGDFVYPASAPQAAPGDVAPTEDEIEQFLQLLSRWNWVDGPDVPWLFFGWLCTSYIPAALPFRPTGYVQGGTGCGKSALLECTSIASMDRALKYENATATRIREDFGNQNEVRPVIINEAETSEDNRRLMSLIEMARYVYTAGEGRYGRGGSSGSDTTVISQFLFAAIEPPPLLPQDANRICMLRLGKLRVSSDQMERFEQEMPAIARRLGPKLARRVVEVFPLFAQALHLFRTGLIAKKHSPRSANTFGVLLAMAHLVRWGAVPDASDVDEWATKMDAKLLATRDDHRSTEGLCLMRLLTFRCGPMRDGDQQPLGEYINAALHARDPDVDLRIIKRYGISVVTASAAEGEPEEKFVAVSNRHEGLEEVFKGTGWAKGGWVNAFRLFTGARPSPNPIWFAGSKDRATLLPAALFPKSPGDTFMGNYERVDFNPRPAVDGESEGDHV
jgi:hypothetical protein